MAAMVPQWKSLDVPLIEAMSELVLRLSPLCSTTQTLLLIEGPHGRRAFGSESLIDKYYHGALIPSNKERKIYVDETKSGNRVGPLSSNDLDSLFSKKPEGQEKRNHATLAYPPPKIQRNRLLVNGVEKEHDNCVGNDTRFPPYIPRVGVTNCRPASSSSQNSPTKKKNVPKGKSSQTSCHWHLPRTQRALRTPTDFEKLKQSPVISTHVSPSPAASKRGSDNAADDRLEPKRRLLEMHLLPDLNEPREEAVSLPEMPKDINQEKDILTALAILPSHPLSNAPSSNPPSSNPSSRLQCYRDEPAVDVKLEPAEDDQNEDPNTETEQSPVLPKTETSDVTFEGHFDFPSLSSFLDDSAEFLNESLYSQGEASEEATNLLCPQPSLPFIGSETLLKPLLLFGWTREIVFRSSGKSSDTYYWSPSGKKYRSMREVEDYLTKTNNKDLSVDNFIFLAGLVGGGEREKTRVCRPKVSS